MLNANFIVARLAVNVYIIYKVWIRLFNEFSYVFFVFYDIQLVFVSFSMFLLLQFIIACLLCLLEKADKPACSPGSGFGATSSPTSTNQIISVNFNLDLLEESLSKSSKQSFSSSQGYFSCCVSLNINKSFEKTSSTNI